MFDTWHNPVDKKQGSMHAACPSMPTAAGQGIHGASRGWSLCKGWKKRQMPACRRAKSMMQGTVMTHQTLASCLIIPQHLSIAIDSGVHLEGLSLVIVIVLWIMDPQEALRAQGSSFRDGPSCVNPNIARHQNHKFSGKALNLSRSFSATLATQVRQTHTVFVSAC